MVLERQVVGFCEELFLKLLVAERGPILVRKVSFLKGAVRDSEREFPVFRLQSHNPIGIIPAAGL
jgi:hypothetical protein